MGLALSMSVLAAGCQTAPVSDVQQTSEATAVQYADRPRLNGPATVEMTVRTASGEGRVVLELDGDRAPLTAGNFVDLVQKQFYDGLTFHRVVNEPVPFVIQGGDPNGNGTGGYVDPETSRPRQIPLEIAVGSDAEPLYNTPIDPGQGSSPPALRHTRRALAMARSNAPNSASSQFYIALSDQPQLDGRYAVFGYVTEGMEIVDAVRVGDTIVSARVVTGLDNFAPNGSPPAPEA